MFHARFGYTVHFLRPITTNKVLRYEVGLVWLLFKIARERAIHDSGVNAGGIIFHKSSEILARTDHIELIGRSIVIVTKPWYRLHQKRKRTHFT